MESIANSASSLPEPRLPPLETLRYFEAVARYGSFASASRELCVTPGAVAHRINTLETSIGQKLFVRRRRHGVELTWHGAALLPNVQQILTDLGDVVESIRRRRDATDAAHLRIAAAEAGAVTWLLPLLSDFKATHPDLVLEVDTSHREADPDRQEFDVRIAYATEVEVAPDADILFEETLVPVCSPALLQRRGRPSQPADLRDWPLLHDLEWKSDWTNWFAHWGVSPSGLSGTMGFRPHRMVIEAAIGSMGAALVRFSMIVPELGRGTLISLFDEYVLAPARYLVVTAPAAGHKPVAQAFRSWILSQASAIRERGPSIARLRRAMQGHGARQNHQRALNDTADSGEWPPEPGSWLTFAASTSEPRLR